MPDKWPTLNEQLSAVLGAPIPFFIAVALIAWATWLAWRWRFQAVFEKQKELYELSRREVEHWKTNAELTAEELAEQIEQLQKQQQNLTEEAKKQLEQARAGLTELNGQLNRLGQANNSAIASSTTVNRSFGDGGRQNTFDWMTRNPTDSTGRSA